MTSNYSGTGNETVTTEPTPSCDDELAADSYNYTDYTQLDPVRHVFTALYFIVIILSLCGNAMVILTVSRNRHMRTVTNCYLVNLATSDFLVASCVMPLKLLEYTAPACEWTLWRSDWLCSLLYFALPVFVFTSVLTLIAISIERYYAVVHPISAKMFTSKVRTLSVIASTWLVAIFCALPYLYCKSYAFSIVSPYGSVSRYICTDRFDDIDEWMYQHVEQNDTESAAPTRGHFRKGFFMFLFVAMYVVPSTVILFTCVRIAIALGKPVASILNRSSASYKNEDNKRKIARMVIVIAVTFLVLWSPFYLITFISQVQTVSFLTSHNFLFTMLFIHLIGFTNSAVNPFVYALLGDKFRTAFVRLMIDLLSTICCLSYSERGRRIRRHWLSITDSSSLTGAGAAGTAGAAGSDYSRAGGYSVAEPSKCHYSKNNQIKRREDIKTRRENWSKQRSFSSSELISRQNPGAKFVKSSSTLAPFKTANTTNGESITSSKIVINERDDQTETTTASIDGAAATSGTGNSSNGIGTRIKPMSIDNNIRGGARAVLLVMKSNSLDECVPCTQNEDVRPSA